MTISITATTDTAARIITTATTASEVRNIRNSNDHSDINEQ